MSHNVGSFGASERYGTARGPGAQRVHELCMGGAERPLTNANRQEYVDLYVDHILNTSINDIFRSFRDGFWTVCRGSQAISLFR